MIPGTGELDLRRLLAALPSSIPVSVEAPTLELATVPFGEGALKLRAATAALLEKV
jgi:hypothetical protein